MRYIDMKVKIRVVLFTDPCQVHESLHEHYWQTGQGVNLVFYGGVKDKCLVYDFDDLQYCISICIVECGLGHVHLT